MPQTEKGFDAINPLASFGKLRPGAVQLTVKREVTPQELHKVLDRILELHGCPTCGLNGLDVLIRPVQPITELFREFASVVSIEQSAY